ncbi:MAG: hypothetical protein RR573_03515 [Oscillospiraceae bacterium]
MPSDKILVVRTGASKISGADITVTGTMNIDNGASLQLDNSLIIGNNLRGRAANIAALNIDGDILYSGTNTAMPIISNNSKVNMNNGTLNAGARIAIKNTNASAIINMNGGTIKNSAAANPVIDTVINANAKIGLNYKAGVIENTATALTEYIIKGEFNYEPLDTTDFYKNKGIRCLSNGNTGDKICSAAPLYTSTQASTDLANNVYYLCFPKELLISGDFDDLTGAYKHSDVIVFNGTSQAVTLTATNGNVPIGKTLRVNNGSSVTFTGVPLNIKGTLELQESPTYPGSKLNLETSMVAYEGSSLLIQKNSELAIRGEVTLNTPVDIYGNVIISENITLNKPLALKGQVGQVEISNNNKPISIKQGDLMTAADKQKPMINNEGAQFSLLKNATISCTDQIAFSNASGAMFVMKENAVLQSNVIALENMDGGQVQFTNGTIENTQTEQGKTDCYAVKGNMEFANLNSTSYRVIAQHPQYLWNNYLIDAPEGLYFAGTTDDAKSCLLRRSIVS